MNHRKQDDRTLLIQARQRAAALGEQLAQHETQLDAAGRQRVEQMVESVRKLLDNLDTALEARARQNPSQAGDQ